MSKNLDSQNLNAIIKNLPQQFLDGYNSTDIKLPAETKKIIFCGMGGSATPANLLKTYLAVAKIDCAATIKINRDYVLPKAVDKNWCGFFSSYSGNTEEVLACFKEATKLGLKSQVIMAHSGQLAEIAQNKKLPFVSIPDTKQPRMSYGFYVGALLRILKNSGLIKFDEKKFLADVKNAATLSLANNRKAQKLAQEAKNKIILVYTTNQWKYLAMVWKINFNENAKTQSFWNIFPEMNHNEMVGFTNLLAKYKTFVIKDSDEHIQNIKRMATFTKILGKKINVTEIVMPQGSAMYKLITVLQLGLWTSYYLALNYKIDPAPVIMVEKFKKLLRP